MSDSTVQETQGLLSPFLAWQRYRHAARYIRNDDVVLDLGCGSGKLQQYLPDGATYYGTDIACYWPPGTERMFEVKIGERLPREITRAGVTAVTALALIEHLQEPGTLFADAANVLKPGGRVILTTPHPFGRIIHDINGRIGLASRDASEEHETFLGKRDLRQLAARHGFELVTYRHFLFGMNQVAVFRKRATSA